MTTTTHDAFEAWIKKSLGYGNINTTVTGGYEWIAVAEAWEVWQAATLAERERSASKVDLTTLRKRTLYGMQNGEAVKECELATAIRSGK